MGRKKRFWTLRAPEDTRRRAWWDESVDLAQVVCPSNPDHQRPGKRLTKLSVILHGRGVQDFVWTWLSECLLQQHVLDCFRKEAFTGFGVRPATARWKSHRAEVAPRLWELVVTGWGGVAPPESGVELVEFCPGCSHRVYSGATKVSQLIREDQWDGSDFFMVWPLPKYVFVTDRVASCIKGRGFEGTVVIPPEELDLARGFAPGRLSYCMPDARAREIGEPLGIY